VIAQHCEFAGSDLGPPWGDEILGEGIDVDTASAGERGERVMVVERVRLKPTPLQAERRL
jgi:hypothetical protein